MGEGDNELLSAMVILRPADPALATEPVSGENLALHAPADEAVAEAMAFFRSKGFDVGAFVGTSFSIAAPASRFHSWFGSDLPSGARGDLELDLRNLPPELSRLLSAVSFSEPLDFGPGSP